MAAKDKPNVNSEGQRELDKAQDQIEAFENQVKSLTLDEMNKAPVKEVEQKISKEELAKHGETYLKPSRTIGPGVNHKTGEREKFNEKFRKDYEFQKEYVCFTAYNNMISGDTIEIWTKPFPGMNCEFWQVPANKPVWGPRYLAEQITRARHHNLVMKGGAANPFDGSVQYQDAVGQIQGQIVAKETVQRLDARPYRRQTQISMSSQF